MKEYYIYDDEENPPYFAVKENGEYILISDHLSHNGYNKGCTWTESQMIDNPRAKYIKKLKPVDVVKYKLLGKIDGIA